MKYITYMIIMLGLVFWGCEDDASPSFVTTYPVISVLGDVVLPVEMGTAFVDPGAEAMVGDIAVEVEVMSDVNTSEPGYYSVTYSSTNEDGFSRSESRMVIVYEVGEVAGLYSGIRTNTGTGGPILISSLGGNRYSVSDAAGGYYVFARGDGFGNIAPFTLTLNDDNTFVADPAFNNGFGLAVEVSNGVRSADGQTWSWDLLFPAVNFGFSIVLTKIY
ncbi:immunoglobulin-like domain-containing protein [Membranihabitans marinus]|uniref:immunoglobulin-like domain-containing protein n=1 Tax=Membranihabitans marinus TaxID=1227546 RepID=UPI001F31949E|nr:immunoglobulin-like domain-containing protein [Membranihabitans marinus]